LAHYRRLTGAMLPLTPIAQDAEDCSPRDDGAMSDIPAMRSYLDPLEGLERQLDEFKGFASTVPRLVEAERRRRWEEVGGQPSDGERELVDVYESESGPEQGFGWADFERTALSSAVALSWELFREFLVGEFIEHMNAWVDEGPAQLYQLRDEEAARMQQRFEHLKSRYRYMLNLQLTPQNIPRWDEVEDVKHVRDAIIHNQGMYTNRYARRPNARPPRENAFGLRPEPDQWVNTEVIPLDLDYVRSSLDLLGDTARLIRARLSGS
jgi:hypothetical protein